MGVLLAHLGSTGLLSVDGESAIKKKLEPQEQPTPIFVRALMTIGAWLSAAFLSVFIQVTIFDYSNESSLPMGLGYLVGAMLLRRVAKHFFFHQVALALLVTGFILALVGVADATGYSEETDLVVLTAAALAAITYFFYDDALQRFVMPLAAAIVAAVYLWDDASVAQHWRLNIYVGLELAAVILIFSNERRRARFLPLGYAMAVGVLFGLFSQTVWREEWSLDYLDSDQLLLAHVVLRLLVAAAGVLTIRWAACDMQPALSQSKAWLRNGAVWAALCVAVLLCIVAPPGVMFALLLMVLGRGSSQRRLEVLGVLALVVFLTDYYYSMATPFIDKARLLTGSGLALLAAWWLLTRLLPKTGEKPCAVSQPPSPPAQP
jgi:hypothetical protein